ncbi:hypothetical protein RHP75_15745 [Pseudomonas sp. SG20056]|uniref:hypothetical protein n=1 Tax=Pseudomonas sp. SG20056 TaxID=3074146 RepID=UPI00287FCEB6|nr:hypothetical protein [Pseudomonas sp. SG20056]WNF45818.1 hypothetical protein RHP75_15745 [Pseudomonas sp. SG20056]
MDKNLITEGRKALVSRLETISPANGFSTNAGSNVRTGWFNEVLKSAEVGFPLIVLQKAPGKPPTPGPHAVKLFNGFHVIGAVDVGVDNYDDALEELERDLLLAVMPCEGAVPAWLPRGITGITLGGPTSFPPGNGERAASVIIPVYLHTIIKGI